MKEMQQKVYDVYEMKSIEALEYLKVKELKAINGGNSYWGPFFGAYVLSEIINGIQDGLSAECPPDC